MKAKLDKQAVQDFFVHHGEKLLLVLLVFGVLWMVYGAATRSKYERQPQDLSGEAEQADEHIEKTTGIPGGLTVPEYQQIAQRSQDAISEKAYAWSSPFDNPVFPDPILRSEPPLFPVEDLVANTSVGAFLMKAGPTGQQQMGQRWVVLTGLVPAEKQVQAYQEAFKDLKRPETDTPRYVYYSVERAEVFGDARDANPTWVAINVNQARKIQDSWASMAQEIVPAPYLHDALNFPLGPLMSRSWGAPVAHLPQIPLAAMAEQAPSPESAPKPESPPDRPPGASVPMDDAPPGAAPADGPAGAAAAVEAAEPAEGEVVLGRVPHLLLRFFDYTVEPGKRYTYRVMLWLDNPNYKYQERYLTDPTLAQKQWIKTDWSDPCTPIYVPRDDRLLVGPEYDKNTPCAVKAPVRVTMEPVASVTLLKWMMDRGVEENRPFKIVRGQLANLSSEATVVTDAEGADVVLTDEEEKPARKKETAAGPRILFKSDNLLLDVRGGEKLRHFVEPGELLMLDYDGSLIVRSELDDAPVLAKALEKSPGETTEEMLDVEPAEAKPEKVGSGLFDLDDDSGKKSRKK